jgi:hypothetical protein
MWQPSEANEDTAREIIIHMNISQRIIITKCNEWVIRDGQNARRSVVDSSQQSTATGGAQSPVTCPSQPLSRFLQLRYWGV